MQAVDEEMETIHLYVVREGEKRPYTALPLFCTFLCLLGIVALTLYSAEHPYYEHKRLTVPAIFLPLKVFEAQAPIIPTGVKTYPATYAHGFLTITNGSIISQELPLGVVFISNSGVSVKTDQKVFVPAGSANGFGMSTVSAHLLTSGINLSTLSINEVVGSSLFIRNLSPFTGGHPAYSVKYVTEQDRQQALIKAREQLTLVVAGLHYMYLVSSTQASSVSKGVLRVSWQCLFATYKVPSYMHVSAAKLSGKNFIVDVAFIPPPRTMWVK